MLRAALAIALSLAASAAVAQTNVSVPNVPATPTVVGSGISGTFTAGDLVAGGPGSGQIQDTSALAQGYATMPVGIDFTSAIVYAGASGPANSWIYNQASISGAATNGVDGLISPNHFLIAHDTVTTTSDLYGLSVKLQPDTGHTGGRSALLGYISVIGAPNVATNNAEYVGIQGLASMAINLGGTSGSLANGVGFLFGGNSNAFTASGATFLQGITSWEFDVTVPTGSSVGRKHGIMIVQGATDAVNGTYEDSAIEIASQSGATAFWPIGLEFGSYSSQWAFGATSTLIGATQRTLPSSDSPIALYGINFSAVTFQSGGGFLKSTGFLVDPSGNATANTFVLGSAGTTTNPAIEFTTCCTNCGIVTPASSQWEIVAGGTADIDFGVTTSGRVTVTPPLNLAGSTGAALTFTSTTAGISLRNGGTLVTTPANGSFQHGAADAATAVAQTVRVQSVAAGNSNVNGQNLTVIGSLSTGSGTSGDIIFQTGGTGAGSTAQNAATTAMTIKGATQQVIFAGPIKVTALQSGTPSTYACFDATGNLISSGSAC